MTLDTGAGVPVWPPGLRDETPLPFAVWRVLHHVNGGRPAIEVARLARVTAPEVAEAVAQAARWAGRASQRGQPVTEASARVVTACLTAVLGPMGTFLVEDTLDDLGEGATLGTLLSAVAAQLNEAQVQAFVRGLRERGIA
ncbi:hypothetical protein DAETH_22020 [Deinococcus aetherius]|uniref:DUF8082 domain-containing protein n=1 Tax=Deinococcus aetherius TaxID=200252 RepID=A0ABM8AEK7_9DEIO|nr:hypothetical protein [Deinococcus aetherius]BDP42233.1 hypothetical protein DAETH_22020 [Deinococcus aetherius]